MKFIFLFLVFCSLSAAANSVTLPISPDEGASGFIGEIKFAYGIRNCYGTISAAFAKQGISARQYLYEGKIYTPADLGLTEFSINSLRYATLFADVYVGNVKLGRAKMDNVIFFPSIGCFSETYSIIELVGAKNADYKDKIKDITLQNFEIKTLSTSSKIENLISKKLDAEAEKAQALEKAQKKAKAEEEAKIKAAEDAKKAAAALPASGNLKNSTPGSTPSKPTSAVSAQKAGAQTKSSGLTSTPSAATAVSAPAPTPTPGPSEFERQQKIQQDLADSQESFRQQQMITDQAARDVGDAAVGFVSGISGSGNGVGLSLLYQDTADRDSPFTPLFIGMVFGKVNDPNLQENQGNLTSGIEIQAAFNEEWGNSPTVYTTNKYSKKNRRWDILMEAKFYGNITAMGNFQPYLALGYAAYNDFDRKNNKVDSGWDFVTGYGIALVGRAGFFRFGYNNNLQVSDFGFGIHM